MRTWWKPVMAAFALSILASCGGGGDDASAPADVGNDSAAAQEDATAWDTRSEEPPDQDVTGSAGEQPGERSAVITIAAVANEGGGALWHGSRLWEPHLAGRGVPKTLLGG